MKQLGSEGALEHWGQLASQESVTSTHRVEWSTPTPGPTPLDSPPSTTTSLPREFSTLSPRAAITGEGHGKVEGGRIGQEGNEALTAWRESEGSEGDGTSFDTRRLAHLKGAQPPQPRGMTWASGRPGSEGGSTPAWAQDVNRQE